MCIYYNLLTLSIEARKVNWPIHDPPKEHEQGTDAVPAQPGYQMCNCHPCFYVSHCCSRIPDRRNLRKAGLLLAHSLRASFYHGGEGMAARTWGNRLGCSHIREAKRDEGWGSGICPWDAAVHVCARLCTSRVCLVPHLSQSGNSSQACTEVCLLVILDPVTLTITLSHCPCCAEY